MNKNLKLIVILVAAVLIIGGGTLLYRSLIEGAKISDSENVNSGTEPEMYAFVPFEVTGPDGEKTVIAYSEKKVTVINFWASWCSVCNEEMGVFERLYLDHGDIFDIKMVDLTDGQRETIARAKDYISKKGYTFPVFFDEDYNSVDEYYIVSIPRTLIIDRDGTVICDITGGVTEETFDEIISSYIK